MNSSYAETGKNTKIPITPDFLCSHPVSKIDNL